MTPSSEDPRIVALLGDDASKAWAAIAEPTDSARDARPIEQRRVEDIRDWTDVVAVVCTQETAQRHAETVNELPDEVPRVLVDSESRTVRFRETHGTTTVDLDDTATIYEQLQGVAHPSGGVPHSLLAPDGDAFGERTPTETVFPNVSNTQFREHVMMHIGEPLVVAEAETGIIVEANHAAADLFVRSRGSLIGSEQWELHPFDKRDEYREAFQTAVREGGAVLQSQPGEEVWVNRTDGERVPVDIRRETVTVNDRTYLVDVFHEVTERIERLRTFGRTHDELLVAESPESVFDVLAEFGANQGANAWVGRWDAHDARLTPVVEAIDGGPAVEHGEGVDGAPSASPMWTAVNQNELTTLVDVGREERYDEWAQWLSNSGYQSSVAIPISHNGRVYAGLEIVANDIDGFSQGVLECATRLCDCAGLLLGYLGEAETSTSAMVDLEFTGSRLFFPDIPSEITIDADTVHFDDGSTITLHGEAEAADRAVLVSYFENQPQFADLDVTQASDTYLFSATIEGRSATSITDVTRQLNQYRATILAVESDTSTEVVTIQLPASSITAVVDCLEELVGECTLRTKRMIDSDLRGASRQGLLGELTDRQIEILATAYQLGYYKRPKNISGTELAERFDISPSTVHQHLRSGVGKIMEQLFTETET